MLKTVVIVFAISLFPINIIMAADYDLVILNGRVMDPETKLDAVRNVGIKDGKISAITTESIKGKETIDASGHVVAPGFIDTHYHALDGLAVRLALRDGVTTGMDLEWGALNIDAWYAAKKNKWPMNYGTGISHEGARMIVHDRLELNDPVDATTVAELRAEAGKDGVIGWSETRSNIEQMNRISKILDEGLRQGAIGVSSTVGYMRTGVTTYEMFEAQRAAARYGRLTAAHPRFHPSSQTPTESPLGFDELFTNAFLLGAPMIYCHDNDYGWWEIEEKLQMARAKGLNMWSEYYPYTAGSTTIGAEFFRPDSWEKGMGYKYEETLYDPSQDKFLNKDEYLDLAKSDPARTIVCFIPPRKEWLPFWLKTPHMAVGADSMWSGLSWDDKYEEYKGHPRTAGCHGKVLRLGRQYNVPLMFSLAQFSYWPAKHLGDAGVDAMKVRGRLQVGMVADIVIFDSKNAKDNATYKAGEQGLPTTGIPYVVVNGNMVVKDSKFQKVWAGEPIRYPVETQGRFTPASKKQWLKSHTIDSGGIKPNVKPMANSKAGLKESTGSKETASSELRNLHSPSWFAGRLPKNADFCCEYHMLLARIEKRKTTDRPSNARP
ncbi:amidohydrolase family protein [Rubinisphaera italica]|uniref:Allantoinase n=1 Tax=Rubinisphaera italica TaxID=2527969 RepID=A0A5C5XD70_9PLAN|nr:amidohydrolase family protein [Rubinisphaera italica]TWT60940.1 Allantoinase [Rubinisphaera italica]